MLKVGDILWTFYGNTYSVGEISGFSLVELGKAKNQYYFVSTKGIIGADQNKFIPVENLDTLAEVQWYSEPTYYTISEKEAVKFMESHYND